MAETGKKAAAGSVPPVNDPAPDIARNDANVTPDTPDESRNASVLVRTAWPHTSFIVENVPEVTSEGTMLTKPQLAQVEKAAGPSGVVITSEEVK